MRRERTVLSNQFNSLFGELTEVNQDRLIFALTGSENNTCLYYSKDLKMLELIGLDFIKLSSKIFIIRNVDIEI